MALNVRILELRLRQERDGVRNSVGNSEHALVSTSSTLFILFCFHCRNKVAKLKSNRDTDVRFTHCNTWWIRRFVYISDNFAVCNWYHKKYATTNVQFDLWHWPFFKCHVPRCYYLNSIQSPHSHNFRIFYLLIYVNGAFLDIQSDDFNFSYQMFMYF